MKDVETGEIIIKVGEGHRREYPLSRKTQIMNKIEKRAKEREKLYGVDQDEFNKFDLSSLNGSDKGKIDMLKNQLGTMYKEIQYMQNNGLWRELKEVREMFLKALKLEMDEDYRQKDDMSSGQMQYDQLKTLVNKLLQFIVGWHCDQCEISTSIESLIEELTVDADTKDTTTS